MVDFKGIEKKVSVVEHGFKPMLEEAARIGTRGLRAGEPAGRQGAVRV